jgi:hypothetical protein
MPYHDYGEDALACFPNCATWTGVIVNDPAMINNKKANSLENTRTRAGDVFATLALQVDVGPELAKLVSCHVYVVVLHRQMVFLF